MNRENPSKLNYVMRYCPRNEVITAQWLKSHGVSYKLAWWYVHSGWLERISDKAYKRVGDKISWSGAIAALQHQLLLPIHVGGKTALQLLGKAHYLPIAGIAQVELFTSPIIKFPSWMTKSNLWDVKFHFYKTQLFNTDVQPSYGLTEQEINGVTIKLSAPERAMMEVFYNVPHFVTYEESLQLMENLVRMRSTVIQKLLEACHSIKVKRLFMHAAEKFQHPWLEEINLETIDFGKGKRKIGEGGCYDAQYQLSVPKLRIEL
jgi:hypothetical protein